MRTYILALTKYALTAVVVIYTVLSFILLVSKKRNVHSVLAYLQSVLMLVFQLIAYVTLSVAMNDPTYIFFSIVQLVTFFIATALFRNLYRKAYLPLFNNMCFLLSIGLVIISRLSFSSAWRQFVIAVGGLAIAIILPLFRRYFHLLKLPKFYWGLAGIVILSVVMLLGSSTLGANITWSIGGLTFQPSEFVKILYLLFLACTLKDVKTLKDIFLVGVFAGAHVLVLIGSNDLGSGLIYYVVFFFMLYLATDSILLLLGGTGLLAVGAVVCYHFFNHVQLRVAAYRDPWSYIDSIGYQITQALFAIGAGGAFGSGLGQGTPDKIPFATTDFIFASCCEEYGLIIGVCIILISLNCFFVMLKLSAASAAMAVYLASRFAHRIPSYAVLLLSVAYALSEYGVHQSVNIMWLDGFCLLPLVLLGVWRAGTRQGGTCLVLASVCAMIFNWYSGCIDLLFAGFFALWEGWLFCGDAFRLRSFLAFLGRDLRGISPFRKKLPAPRKAKAPM